LNSTRVKKLLIIAFVSLAFTSLGLEVLLDNYYCRSRQNIPEPSLGRVHHLIVCHGASVYLSYAEYVIYEHVLPVTAAVFFIGAISVAVRGRSRG